MIHAFVRKFGDVLYDVTVGLLRQYKRTTIDLAKIELASYYVRLVKIVRQECMISILIIFGVIIFTNAVGVVQMSIVLYAPWSVPARILAALAFGIVSAVVPLLIVLRFFSQRRWMEITKADEFMARAMESSGYSTNGASGAPLEREGAAV